MRSDTAAVEDLVRRSARVRDEELAPLGGTPAARALLAQIVDSPHEAAHRAHGRERPAPDIRRVRGPSTRGLRRVTQVAIATLLVLGVLSVPALGVIQHIASWMSDWAGPDAPKPLSPDDVIASGVAGVPWRILATRTDQGICLFTVSPVAGGTGGCGWGTDIRGYPGAAPHGYGAGGDQIHWVEGTNGSGGDAAYNRRIVKGVAAQDVTGVELVLAGGRTMHANVVERPKGINVSLNFWWAVLPPEVDGLDLTSLDTSGDAIPVHAIVAIDATGTVLERRIVDQPNG